MPEVETLWTNECVIFVIRGERVIDQMEWGSFGVGDHAYTGGPVLRGPWGSVIGIIADHKRFEEECDRLNKAFIQGFLRARFSTCQTSYTCTTRAGQNYCRKCGATVVVDRRVTSPAALPALPSGGQGTD